MGKITVSTTNASKPAEVVVLDVAIDDDPVAKEGYLRGVIDYTAGHVPPPRLGEPEDRNVELWIEKPKLRVGGRVRDPFQRARCGSAAPRTAPRSKPGGRGAAPERPRIGKRREIVNRVDQAAKSSIQWTKPRREIVKLVDES